MFWQHVHHGSDPSIHVPQLDELTATVVSYQSIFVYHELGVDYVGRSCK